MSRGLAALALGIGVCAAAGADSRNILVGSWRLVSYVDTPEGGEPIYAFGRNPVGLFLFTADGHVSISMMRNPPDVNAPITDPDPDACVPGWYCAYFGTYSVDAAKGEWVTHVTGGNIPAYLNTDQRRSFTRSGERITINESYLLDGRRVAAVRILVREPGPR